MHQAATVLTARWCRTADLLPNWPDPHCRCHGHRQPHRQADPAAGRRQTWPRHCSANHDNQAFRPSAPHVTRIRSGQKQAACLRARISNKIEHKYLAAGSWVESTANWHGWDSGKDSPARTGERGKETSTGTADFLLTRLRPSTWERGPSQWQVPHSGTQRARRARDFLGYGLQLLRNRDLRSPISLVCQLFPLIPGPWELPNRLLDWASEEELEGNTRPAAKESQGPRYSPARANEATGGWRQACRSGFETPMWSKPREAPGRGWQLVSNQERVPSRAPCPCFPNRFSAFTSLTRSLNRPHSRRRTGTADQLHRERCDGGV